MLIDGFQGSFSRTPLTNPRISALRNYSRDGDAYVVCICQGLKPGYIFCPEASVLLSEQLTTVAQREWWGKHLLHSGQDFLGFTSAGAGNDDSNWSAILLFLCLQKKLNFKVASNYQLYLVVSKFYVLYLRLIARTWCAGLKANAMEYSWTTLRERAHVRIYKINPNAW